MLNSEKGSALVIILVISTLLLASSFWAVSTYKEGVRTTEQFLDKMQARLGAESALQILKYYGATGQFGSSTLSRQLPEKLNFPNTIRLTGDEYTLSLQDMTVTVSLLDSSALLNCFYMDIKTLARLLYAFGMEDEQLSVYVNSYRDWIDKNDFHHVNGAESYYYKHELKAAFSPRNSKAMQSPWEMSLIKGMDDTRWKELRSFLMLSPKPGLNIQTMSPRMLSAHFGVDMSQALQLARYRRENGYLTNSTIEATIGRIFVDEYSGLNNFPSRIVRLRIEASAGDARERYLGWVTFIPDRQGPFRILSWTEGGGDE
ncbi:general secretion pathway protein GspK [Desulfocapsa sp. AH-315-G09]|uniref:General secretion pathway protein GspK n=1 Tax=Desulfotalea psychrophila TaxID=84980 RepID=A0ABS3AVC0_9BACT|nr:general secretion pathway protein GspK [Desulfocapsa sp.]MBN4065426.1 general secretion pathway protein GspK [Desulfocapsa sp. AH-315-G09]MBN4068704.1 general secretion pathway protein GspK [Desulfotalea psychrophila]